MAGVSVVLGGVHYVVTTLAVPGFRLAGTDADEAGNREYHVLKGFGLCVYNIGVEEPHQCESLFLLSANMVFSRVSLKSSIEISDTSASVLSLRVARMSCGRFRTKRK